MKTSYEPYEHPRWKDSPIPKVLDKKGIKVDSEKQKKFEEMKKKAVEAWNKNNNFKDFKVIEVDVYDQKKNQFKNPLSDQLVPIYSSPSLKHW